MSYQRISYEVKDQVAWIGFGHNCDKSMTVLDEPTLKELQEVVERLYGESKNLKGAVFHSHKERCFLAGADINLIDSMTSESAAAEGAAMGQQIYNRIEDLPFATIATVHGVCLGGGTELVLACRYIIVSNDSATVLGLPEVKLGIIPGFGGTFRMPKRIGLPAALDIILTGKMVKAAKAKKLGLVDQVYAKEALPQMALSFLIKKGKNKKHLSFAVDNFVSKKIIFQKARENVLAKTKGFYQAPLKILDVMENGMMKGRNSYMASESQAFGELCMSEQSKNLRHIFFMVEEAKKYPGPSAQGMIANLQRGAVLGAGTMGGGIAWLMADHNMAPIMKDLNPAGLELGLKQAAKNFGEALKRRKLSYDDFERKQRSIMPQLDNAGFKRVDLVIEAVVEKMEIKKQVFSDIENYVSDETLLTSNTSSLSVEEMAGALKKPERFAGLHFFNPVHRMPLVEIITHSKVAPETLQALYEWVLRVKKTPVIVKDGPGFLVNRILMPYLNEAGFLLSEGMRVKDLDEACMNFGMPMGPCRLLDEIGIDVGVKVAHILHDGLGERAQTSGFSQHMVERDWLGKKSGIGFYKYDEKGKPAGENGQLKELLPKKAKSMDQVDIQMRVFLPMINEAAVILDEGIVDHARTVDLGLIFGIGFPPFRGGLLRYADSEGLDDIVKALDQYAEQVSADRYAACDYLKKLVAQSKRFYDV